MSIWDRWEMVIGLEIHVRLATNSKLFSGMKASYGASPNSQVSFLDAGLPGTLPVINQKALEYAIRFGLAVDAEIPPVTVFARKNYFYPDLPKGYQISQMDDPIVGKGHIVIKTDEGEKTVEITRAHLEEDAGKSIHDKYDRYSAIDLNRAGTPLIEVVSEPQMSNAKEAVAYMREIYTRVTHLGICDGNLQEGSFRCDANVSVRPKGQKELGTRAEIKNLNSFRFIEKAINHEAKRQIKLLEAGEKIIQETRLYDADKDQTRSMRSKENANDYRYFPDPDQLPIAITDAMIEAQREHLPEFPEQKIQRYINVLKVKADDAAIIANDIQMAAFFEAADAQSKADADLNAKFLLGEFSALLNAKGESITTSKIDVVSYAGLLDVVAAGGISRKVAKTVLEDMWDSGEAAAAIIKAKGLGQISDSSALNELINQVIADNPSQVADYRAGNEKMFNYFIGQIMKKTKGQANPVQTKQLLEELLNE
ncbi:Asp-tRNA(Asn)/Glu-tRNA(Gln) amidotransferase subunit GatB [Marinicella sp. S1101]|uniref:Asp-tRNA(Asn)/Glu-tRNA(Gln) amidotransferase subunit GatB n=1 Tax=Marinicella marina TaxID=2996016 RepID=UPI002260AE1D|nr:Asp-tRNA(Asn)/Glu-tRNA(Gln) amidotransferase subunit GatB [Marinicella marina]MCX7552530.1 Asp-tRNA(Asn)/Glu-tRNA(Gln) amidotransferase subunit GatB [Marinicella marina]MDJ1139406.1 Asp-tRNA(Asn)/Glu-tRNA(Gln) amidotransferase subunit GatB [Marinicella marina]